MRALTGPTHEGKATGRSASPLVSPSGRCRCHSDGLLKSQGLALGDGQRPSTVRCGWRRPLVPSVPLSSGPCNGLPVAMRPCPSIRSELWPSCPLEGPGVVARTLRSASTHRRPRCYRWPHSAPHQTPVRRRPSSGAAEGGRGVSQWRPGGALSRRRPCGGTHTQHCDVPPGSGAGRFTCAPLGLWNAAATGPLLLVGACSQGRRALGWSPRGKREGGGGGGEGCIGRGGGVQGAQPMPSHCPSDAKCQPQWHL